MRAYLPAWVAVALIASPAAAEIHVWKEKDQQGQHRRIRRAVRDLKNLGFDDAISSLQADERWQVCSEPLYRGDCRLVEGTVPNLRLLGFNNRITSMRPAPPEADSPAEPEPELEAERAATSARRAPEPKPEPEDGTVLPDAKSWRTPPPAASAAERPAPSPAPSAREWWRGEEDAAVFAAPGEKVRRKRAPRIELYAEANYGGRRLRLDRPIQDVADLGQPVASLLVRSGTWEVCSRPGFQGDCTTLDAKAEGLAQAGIGSLRPVPSAN